MNAALPSRLQPGRPYPLGAHCDAGGVFFAVYAEHATRVDLCLFDAHGRHELKRLAMPECVDGVWHGFLEGAGPGLLYGYRAEGPYQPDNGHRFNANKLLLDPYAREISGQIRWHDALHGYRIGASRGDLSFDRRDSAAYMPKGVVTGDDGFDWGDDRPPNTAWTDTLIYEAHVRGLTTLRQDIPEPMRGSFGALGHPAMIEHLERIGVTAVELLPVHAFARDRILVEQGLTNYWGYNTLSYFAPDPAYLSDGSRSQIKWAIRELHAAGIEVILDVVYNHTCEGNEFGTTLSLRGLANASYYRLLPEEPRFYINDSGCGNTVNMSHPRTIQLVMDSLRHWVQEYRVDGFRFDLCSTLGREPDGFDPGAGFFDALLQDPLLARVKLIAEPWDIGPGGYQLGNHPPGFGEWNDRFRDDVRSYWRGEHGMRGALAARLQGSAELFDHQRRRPWSSINFVTAHDGFTLHDVVSYSAKHNHANGEGNNDGTDNNESHNWGVEGPTDRPEVIAQREQIKRNLLATLLLSHGTPMLLAGDEFGQTQHGNNNVYCQDNPISWLDWTLAQSPAGQALQTFVARLAAIRKHHRLLQGSYFQHGRIDVTDTLSDIKWVDERGRQMTEDDWHNGVAHLLGLQRACRHADGSVEVLLMLFNGDVSDHRFLLPPPRLGYQVLIDTAAPDVNEDSVSESRVVAAHAMVLLKARIDAGTADPDLDDSDTADPDKADPGPGDSDVDPDDAPPDDVGQ
jgi:isoamylase